KLNDFLCKKTSKTLSVGFAFSFDSIYSVRVAENSLLAIDFVQVYIWVFSLFLGVEERESCDGKCSETAIQIFQEAEWHGGSV
ncbi:MAG: hypothetical protein PHY82_10845, partial [Lentisphaeria bacterium]|nr:hypothetical protein [Lentisphaeria bacterium]